MTQHLVLALLWILFCALHSGLASGRAKRKAHSVLGTAYRSYRLSYTLFAAVNFAVVLLYQFSIASPVLYRPAGVLYAFGGFTGGAGLVVMLLCIQKYFAGLSGLREFVGRPDEQNVLFVSGLHRHVRHPLYLGTFLFIWGLFLVLPYASLLISNFIITVYTVLGIRWEEEKLVARFGDDYRTYRRNVPMLIPFLKK